MMSSRSWLAPIRQSGSSSRSTGFALLAAAALLGACATAPAPSPKTNSSYVVLLDNGDGTTGKVHVTGPQGLTVLDTAHTGTLLAGPAGNRFAVDDAKMNADFAAAVAASPRRPITYRLYFEFGTSRLTQVSRAESPRILEEIARRAAPDISIVGHTDTTGDAASNLALGLTRARLVADLLRADNQIPVDKVSLESHGEKNPLVVTANNVEEARNRRVEVTVR